MCGAVNVQRVKLFCQYVTQGPTMVNSNRSTMIIAIGLKDFKINPKIPICNKFHYIISAPKRIVQVFPYGQNANWPP